MDDIARSVRHVHNQRTRTRDKHADPRSEDCERAPLVVSHDVGFRVTGGELVVELAESPGPVTKKILERLVESVDEDPGPKD